MIKGEGFTTPAPGTRRYGEGSSIVLWAFPAAGWKFAGWTGAVTDPAADGTNVVMDSDKVVTANFVPIPAPTPPASSSAAPGPATSSSPPSSAGLPPVSEPGPASATPTIYRLEISVEGGGTTTPRSGAYSYAGGTKLNLSAVPDAGWQFAGWVGPVDNTGAAATSVVMSGDTSLTAVFTRITGSSKPVLSHISSAGMSLTEVEITWTTDEPSDSQVEYWASPHQLSSLDTAMVTGHRVRLTGLTPGTVYHFRVMSRDAAGNLEVSGEQEFTSPSRGAEFAAGGWDVKITGSGPSKSAVIMYHVLNSGDIAGSYSADLVMGGVIRDKKELSLGPGEEQKVSFLLENLADGDYEAKIGDDVLFFTVKEAGAGGAATWLPAAGIGAGLLAVAFLGVLAARRLKARNSAAIVQEYQAAQAVPAVPVESAPAVEERRSTGFGAWSREDEGQRTPPPRIRFVDIKPQSVSVLLDAAGSTFTVTGPALDEITDRLNDNKAAVRDHSLLARIYTSQSNPGLLKMSLGKREPDDLALNRNGRTIFFISAGAAELLKGVELGFDPSKGEFMLSRKGGVPSVRI